MTQDAAPHEVDQLWHQPQPWRARHLRYRHSRSSEDWVARTPAIDVFDVAGSAVFFPATRTTLARTDDQVRQAFMQLSLEWSSHAAVSPDPMSMFMHPSYQRIIGLGPQVLPHILAALDERLDHWFWALTAIVGEDVAQGAGTLQEAADRWLEWGRTSGLTT